MDSPAISYTATADADNYDIENITDISVLQEMVEHSEDLEFRRLVRIQIRKLKKEKQENSEPLKHEGTRTTIPQQKFLPQTDSNNDDDNDIKLSVSNLKKSESNSTRSPIISDANHRTSKLFESVKLRTPPVTKDSKEDKTPTSQKYGNVILKITNHSTSPGTKLSYGSSKESILTQEVNLKHVTTAPPTTGGSGSVVNGSVLRNKGNPTPRQALKHFKQMDNDSILRNSGGIKNPLDAIKWSSKALSPNNIRNQTLYWCQNRLYGYENINIEDFSTSWSNGLAFCALANSLFPHAFDYDSLTSENRRCNFQLAFDTLEREAGVVPLLEVDDMISTRNPDWKCVFTYVNTIIGRMNEIRKEGEENRPNRLVQASTTDD